MRNYMATILSVFAAATSVHAQGTVTVTKAVYIMDGTGANVSGTYTLNGFTLQKITVSIRVVGGQWSNPVEAFVDRDKKTFTITFMELDKTKKHEVQVIGHWQIGMGFQEVPGNTVEIPYEECGFLRDYSPVSEMTRWLCLDNRVCLTLRT
jgi:hypothetical protein